MQTKTLFESLYTKEQIKKIMLSLNLPIDVLPTAKKSIITSIPYPTRAAMGLIGDYEIFSKTNKKDTNGKTLYSYKIVEFVKP